MMRKITETDLAKLFFSERGLRKLLRGRQYYPVINQCDDEEKLMQAGKIAKQLEILQRERLSDVFGTQQAGKTVPLIGSCFLKK